VVCGLFLTTLPASAQVGTLGTVWQRQGGRAQCTLVSHRFFRDGTKLIAGNRLQPNLASTVYLHPIQGSPGHPPVFHSLFRVVDCSILSNGQTSRSPPEWLFHFHQQRRRLDEPPLAPVFGVPSPASTNGTTIVAAKVNGQLYSPPIREPTWTPRAQQLFLADIASSGDGQTGGGSGGQ